MGLLFITPGIPENKDQNKNQQFSEKSLNLQFKGSNFRCHVRLPECNNTLLTGAKSHELGGVTQHVVVCHVRQVVMLPSSTKKKNVANEEKKGRRAYLEKKAQDLYGCFQKWWYLKIDGL